MSNIPIVTKEAIKEAYKKFECVMIESAKTGDHKLMESLLRKSSHTFEDRQPRLFEFVSNLVQSHAQNTDGVMLVSQLVLYSMIMLNSIYIQEEINDVGDIFKGEDK